jgi:hypothetical protein
VFLYRHVYLSKAPDVVTTVKKKPTVIDDVYEEPLMSKGYYPAPLPLSWYNIAKKGLKANRAA